MLVSSPPASPHPIIFRLFVHQLNTSCNCLPLFPSSISPLLPLPPLPSFQVEENALAQYQRLEALTHKLDALSFYWPQNCFPFFPFYSTLLPSLLLLLLLPRWKRTPLHNTGGPRLYAGCSQLFFASEMPPILPLLHLRPASPPSSPILSGGGERPCAVPATGGPHSQAGRVEPRDGRSGQRGD